MKNIISAILIALVFTVSTNAQEKPKAKADCAATCSKACTDKEKAKCVASADCTKGCTDASACKSGKKAKTRKA